jgi:HK97 family phage prohead protease
MGTEIADNKPIAGQRAGREQRTLHIGQLHVRAASDGASPHITGYAAVFNQESEVLSDWFTDFREIIAVGAFTKTLADGADVRALWNHDPNFVLGRTKSGTLSLKEDDTGLWMDITPPNTGWARDLMETMKRGDVDGSSFGFQTIRDRWSTTKDENGDDVDLHNLLEARLFDVSVVTFPAYPQTDSAVRSVLAGAAIDVDPLLAALSRATRGQALGPGDRDALQHAMTRLEKLLPAERNAPSSPAHPSPVRSSTPVDPDHVRDVKQRLRKLELYGPK